MRRSARASVVASLLLGVPVLCKPAGAAEAGVPAPDRVEASWGMEFRGTVPAASPDTMDGINRVRRLIRNHYRGIDRLSTARGDRPNPRQDRLCEGSEGLICHGGDPDRGLCNANVPCHPTNEFLLEGLEEEARRYPQSGFLMGQAVYAFTKFGLLGRAEELVDACEAEPWWCEALQAYLLYSEYAPMTEVEGRFRSALEKAPDDIRCRWGDATWLLGEWDQRVGGRAYLPEAWEATRDWDCTRRMAVSDTLFWLANPLYSREGNDRWTVHMARAMAAHIYAQLREVVRGRPFPEDEVARDWAMRVRRGPWDSYQFLGDGRQVNRWTSVEAARYHFIPQVSLDDLSRPRWQLQGDIMNEGYTPDYGPLFIIPGQVARFRDRGRLKVAAAAGVEGSRLERALDLTAHLVLTDGPWSISAMETAEFREARPMVVAEGAPRDYVLSLEVETDLGFGLHRELISPLTMDEPELSDLVLFEAEEFGTQEASPGGVGTTGTARRPRQGNEAESRGMGEEPASLDEIGSRMLGRTTLSNPREVGVFWEVYGIPEDQEASFDLTLERAAGGLVDRLRGLFPGGEQEGRGQVSWTEPSTGLTHPRAITLDLAGLQPGRYTLTLRARWGELVELERRRAFRIEDEG